MFSVAVLLLLAAASFTVHSIDLVQPDSVVVQPGQSLTISCRVSGYSLTDDNYATGWIRQREGKLEWIFHQWGTSGIRQNNALKNKFSLNRDTSAGTVTIRGATVQPEDSGVYYCVRYAWGGAYAFDYWGKGTTVTVTSATSTAPTVFPVLPCGSGTGDTVTLACLATGFSPSAVSFAWSLDDNTLTDSIQYPPVLKDNVYSGVSQLQVKRQEWNARKTFKCKVDHAAGSKEVQLIKPKVVYIRPSLKILTFEENEKITFSCLANDFSPNVYEFKWLKNNEEITDKTSEITTPSKDRKDKNGTLYTAASFLTLSSENMQDTHVMCIFNLGSGENVQSVNSTHTYIPPDKPCSGSDVEVQMEIIPPSLEHMLLLRKGKLVCKVTVNTNPQNVKKFFWSDENNDELVNGTDRNKNKNSLFTLPLDITYDEWNSGITRTCEMQHDDLMDPLQKTYQRKKEPNPKRPSVFMLPPLKQTSEKMVTLTCYVKDFFPQEIYVRWQVDNGPTNKFSTTNSIQSNGSYYAYSQLTIPLIEWENSNREYSCQIYHESIDQNSTIIRSIAYHSSEQTNMVNLNMNLPSMCTSQ